MHPNGHICPCCAYRCSYLRFPYPFRPRAESATFLFATMECVGEASRAVAVRDSTGKKDSVPRSAASCILIRTLSSLMGLPNPAWVKPRKSCFPHGC
jgi:hypothetical protein